MSRDSERLIAQTTNAIEGFVNFGCIATGIFQIILKFSWYNLDTLRRVVENYSLSHTR